MGKRSKNRPSARDRRHEQASDWCVSRNLYLLACDGKWVWYCKRSGRDVLTWNPKTGFWWTAIDKGYAKEWQTVAAYAVAERDRQERDKIKMASGSW